MKLELCVCDYEGAKLAFEHGFTSIELNSALNLGGLTPSIGTVRSIAKDFDINIICMVRNRPGGFCYTDDEFNEMLNELDILLKENIQGIAFGFLTKEYEIDYEKTKLFVNKIHKAKKTAVFHRAFDNVKCYKEAIDKLVELNVDRVLTSGFKNTAIEGAENLIKILEYANNRIEILAGSGINSENVVDFIEQTKINYVHSSCKGKRFDETAYKNVSFRVYNDDSYQITDKFEVEKFRNEINKIK